MDIVMSLFNDGIKRIATAGMALLVMGSVAGCGASSAEKTIEVTEHNTVLAQSPKGNSKYETRIQTPGIFVDQKGYNADSDKTVVFLAKEMPKNFNIIDLETKAVVYTGEIIKPVLDEASGKYYGIGRFNDFNEPGTYYIYADTIGESYSFSVGEDVYDDVFRRAAQKYYINRCGIAISQTVAGDNGHSACHTTQAHLQDNADVALDVTGGWHMDGQADRDSLIGGRVIENLLLAYEMNSDAFTDDNSLPESGNGIPDIIDEAKYEADWLLKMQDSKTGGVYSAAITQGEGTADIFAAPVVVGSISMDATIEFAAAMARFSYLYQQYDGEFATTALKAADRAYESFLNNQKATDSSMAFDAAAQLYRATGSSKYNDVLTQYFNMDDFNDRFEKDENIFFGSVTYLSTSRGVDKNQCSILIKALMNRAEDIAKRASTNTFPVADLSEADGFEQLLDDIRCLTVTNHIIYNHEYKTIIENHLHFLMGMNPSCINYVTGDTERTYLDDPTKSGLMNDPVSNALLMLLVSAVK